MRPPDPLAPITYELFDDLDLDTVSETVGGSHIDALLGLLNSVVEYRKIPTRPPESLQEFTDLLWELKREIDCRIRTGKSAAALYYDHPKRRRGRPRKTDASTDPR